jgi:hypothetical protein
LHQPGGGKCKVDSFDCQAEIKVLNDYVISCLGWQHNTFKTEFLNYSRQIEFSPARKDCVFNFPEAQMQVDLSKNHGIH